MKNGSTNNPTALYDLFYRGNYADVVAQTIDAHPSVVPVGGEPLVIGSLGYLGRVGEAKHLFDRLYAGLPPEDQSAAQYHLAVGLTRHSQYAEAEQLFARNLRIARRSTQPLIRFYGHFGVAFYRFFCGRFAHCIRTAELAMLDALDANFTFGKCLAFELLGHAKVNVGRIAEGLADIRQAERLASSFGNGSMVEAFHIARACYEAQFGINGDAALSELEKLYQATPPQNTYSRATLLFELSRVKALHGAVSEAQQYLNQASRIIYETKHRRYGAYLNFRYAYHAYLAGKFEEALNLLRVADASIHKKIDRLLELKILDLELKVRQQLQLGTDQASANQKEIEDLTRRIGNLVADRIYARSYGGFPPRGLAIAEDAIGDLFDQSNHEDLIPELIYRGYATPLRAMFDLPFGKRLVILNLTSETSLIVDRADMRMVKGLSQQLQKLLTLLSAGEQSKDQLVSGVWGYQKYDPLRHDGILFQSVTRLRTLLGPQRDWILNTDHGYRLIDGLIIKNLVAEGGRTAQLKEQLKARPFTTKEYIDSSGVSKATACRDLAELVASQSVKKIGKGKTTKYIFT